MALHPEPSPTIRSPHLTQVPRQSLSLELLLSDLKCFCWPPPPVLVLSTPGLGGITGS